MLANSNSSDALEDLEYLANFTPVWKWSQDDAKRLDCGLPFDALRSKESRGTFSSMEIDSIDTGLAFETFSTASFKVDTR